MKGGVEVGSKREKEDKAREERLSKGKEIEEGKKREGSRNVLDL